MQLFELLESFAIQKPVELNHVAGDQEIIAYPEKIVLNTPEDTPEDEFIELIARAKMAERDPLLAVFLFQPGYSEIEAGYMAHFARLCFPLQKAWTYRTIREYAPEIYEREIADLVELWTSIRRTDDPLVLPSKTGEIALELYAILKENPENDVHLAIRKNESTDTDWTAYFHTLEEYVHRDPDPELYVALVLASRPGYSAAIFGEGPEKYIHVRAL